MTQQNQRLTSTQKDWKAISRNFWNFLTKKVTMRNASKSEINGTVKKFNMNLAKWCMV